MAVGKVFALLLLAVFILGPSDALSNGLSHGVKEWINVRVSLLIISDYLGLLLNINLSYLTSLPHFLG